MPDPGFQTLHRPHQGPAPWYANPYVILTMLISLVAMAIVSILLLLLFALPGSSQIILYMQGKMASLTSVTVDASVQYAAKKIETSSSGEVTIGDEAFDLRMSGPLSRDADGTAHAIQRFRLSAGAHEPQVFSGTYRRVGSADYFRFDELPAVIGAVRFEGYRDRWLYANVKRILGAFDLPLVGSGHGPIDELDDAALAESFARTPFFEIVNRFEDGDLDGVRVHHYKVKTDDRLLLLEDFYERIEAARLGHELSAKESSTAKTFFADLRLADADLWIGTRDYFLHRAAFTFSRNDGARDATMRVDLRFDGFGASAAAAPGLDGATDVTKIVASLLPAVGNHLPLAKDGGQNRIAKDDSSGTGLPVDTDPDETLDLDHDGLTNALETFYETDPKIADTDGDGMNDGDEIHAGCNPGGHGKLFDFGITKDYGQCK